MTDYWTDQDEAPRLDVRVLRYGHEVHHELCEAISQVNDVTREWGDIDGATIEVIDLMTNDPREARDVDCFDDDDRKLS